MAWIWAVSEIFEIFEKIAGSAQNRLTHGLCLL
jgi:hypothetical protein